MNTLYTSVRPDSQFKIVEVEGEVYAVDEDDVVGGWGLYKVTKPSLFQAGFSERILVTPEGEVTQVAPDFDFDIIPFSDFEFDDDAKCPEDLFL